MSYERMIRSVEFIKKYFPLLLNWMDLMAAPPGTFTVFTIYTKPSAKKALTILTGIRRAYYLQCISVYDSDYPLGVSRVHLIPSLVE